MGILFKHRLNLSKRYHEWCLSEGSKLDKSILMGPESFLVFLQSKGYLNEEKIIDDYEILSAPAASAYRRKE